MEKQNPTMKENLKKAVRCYGERFVGWAVSQGIQSSVGNKNITDEVQNRMVEFLKNQDMLAAWKTIVGDSTDVIIDKAFDKLKQPHVQKEIREICENLLKPYTATAKRYGIYAGSTLVVGGTALATRGKTLPYFHAQKQKLAELLHKKV